MMMATGRNHGIIITCVIIIIIMTLLCMGVNALPEWAPWSECSEPCGGNGVRTRVCDPIDQTCAGASSIPCRECARTAVYSNDANGIELPYQSEISFDLNVTTDTLFPNTFQSFRVYLDGVPLRSDIKLTHVASGITALLVNDSLRSGTEFGQTTGSTTEVQQCSDIRMRRVTLVDDDNINDDLAVNGDIASLTSRCYGGDGWPYSNHDFGHHWGGSFTGVYRADTTQLNDMFSSVNMAGTWRLSITNYVQLGMIDMAVNTPVFGQWGIIFIGSACARGYWMNTSNECESCGIGMTTRYTNATSIDDCICGEGYVANGMTCQDITPPVITCPFNISRTVIPAGINPTMTAYTWVAPVVFDNSGEFINVSAPFDAITSIPLDNTSAPVYTFDTGIHMIGYQATDTSGLESTCIFTITVQSAESLSSCDAPVSQPYPPLADAGSTIAGGVGYYCFVKSSGAITCQATGSADAMVQLTPTDLNYLSISGGAGFACAITYSASVVCWGAGLIGSPPSDVGFRSVSAGQSHACGVTSIATIRCWGTDQGFGETVPVSRSDYVSVAAADTFTCGLTSSGSIICWGADVANQLSSPSGTGWKAVSVNRRRGCAIHTDDTLHCWGDGQGATDTELAHGVTHASSVSMSNTVTLILRTDGTFIGYGSRPGKGGGPYVTTAIMESPLNTNISGASMGTDSIVLRLQDGRVGIVNLGLGGFNWAEPTISPIIKVVTGAKGWTCTLYGDEIDPVSQAVDTGRVQCYNGDGPTDTSYRFQSLYMWDATVACGQLLPTGDIHCWGGPDLVSCSSSEYVLQDSKSSTAGITTATTSDFPSEASDARIIGLTVGTCSVCVLVEDVTSWTLPRWACWGDFNLYTADFESMQRYNYYNRLDSIWDALYGYPNIPISFSPDLVPGLQPIGHYVGAIIPPPGTSFVGVNACMGGRATVITDELFAQKHHHLCDLLDNGSIYCSIHIPTGYTFAMTTWGLLIPPPIDRAADIVFESVTCGESHICGLLSDGTHYCQDVGKFNDLGDDSSVSVLTNQPSSVDYGSFVSVSTHSRNACGVRVDGTILCWGDNTSLQLSVPSLNIFTRVVVGDNTICGINIESVVCWGIAKLQLGPAFARVACSPLRRVSVNPVTGVDATYCGAQLPTSLPCASLNGALTSATLTAYVQIALAGGEYISTGHTNVAFTGVIIRPMTLLEGGNTLPVILNANGASFVITTNLVTFNDITFTNGQPAVSLAEQVTGVSFMGCSFVDNVGTLSGQAVRLQLRSSALFVKCLFANNEGMSGSAIYSQFATVTLTGSSFINNRATIEGGAVYGLACDISVTDTTFVKNQAAIRGGCFTVIQGVLTITDSNVTANAAGTGGAIYANGGVTLTVTGTSFTSNVATTSGGVMSLATNSLPTSIRSSNFTSNTALVSGGVISSSDTSITIDSSIFDGNSAITGVGNGGSIVCIQTGETTPVITVTSSTFSSGSSVNGAALHSSLCNVNISMSSFSDHTATSNGGVIYIADASVTATKSKFTNNKANERGGVVAATSTASVTSTDNAFTANNALRGAVWFIESHALTASGNTYVDNTATGYGSNNEVTSSPTLVVTAGPSSNQASGIVTTTSFTVSLWDSYSNTVYTAGSDVVSVSMSASSGVLTGGLFSTMVNGVTTFDSIVVTAPPATHLVNFSVALATLEGSTRSLVASWPVIIAPCEAGTRVFDNRCVACALGSYSESVNSLSCTQCTAGKAANATSVLPSCASCEKGKYQSSEGQVTCLVCPSGKFSNSTQQSACYDCRAGTAAPGTGSIDHCDICAKGKYASGTGSLECLACPVGTYTDTTGLSVCATCSSAHYQSQTGESTCIACAAGTFSVNSNGETPTAACTEARPGFYVAAAAATTPITCSPGFVTSSYASTACVACVPGYYMSSSQGTQCLKASLGYYVSGTNATQQTPCAAGRYSSSLNASICSQCDEGSWSSLASQGCIPCREGYYQAPGTDRGVTCPACPAGQYSSSTGATRCERCEAGKSATEEASTQCTLCAAGRAASNTGQAQCDICPAGSTAPTMGLLECVLCSRGKYSPTSDGCIDTESGSYVDQLGAGTPTLCQPGHEQPLTGQWNCSACAAGSYASSSGSKTCTLASKGYHAPSTGVITQVACAIGRYSQTEGSSICSLCEPGTYGPATGLTACLTCVGASVAPDAGAAACSECQSFSSALANKCACDPLYYGVVRFNDTSKTTSTTCHPCPSGTSCTSAGSTASAIQVSSATWKLVSLVDGTISTAECPGDRCDQGNCTINRLPVDVNPLCGKCISEDYSEWGGQCVYCTETNWAYVIAVALASFAYVMILRRAAMGNSSSHTKIFSYFIATARFMLNDQLVFLQWLGIFDFSPDRGNGGTCVTPLSAYGQMGMQAFVALLFFVNLGLIAFFDWSIHKIRVRFFKHQLGPYVYDHYFRTFVAILLFSYTSVTDVVFTYLNCYDIGDPTVYSVVWKYPAISCYDSRYKSWFGVVILGLVFPVIGLPVALIITVFYVTRRYRGTDWRAKFAARFGILYETYRPSLAWWEAAALLRRTLFVIVAWALFNAPRSRYLGFNLLNLGFLLIHLWIQPFSDPVCNKLESMSLFSLTVLAALLAGATDVTTTNVDISVWIQVLVTFAILPPLIIFAVVILIKKIGRQCPCMRRVWLWLASPEERLTFLGTSNGRKTALVVIGGKLVDAHEDAGDYAKVLSSPIVSPVPSAAGVSFSPLPMDATSSTSMSPSAAAAAPAPAISSPTGLLTVPMAAQRQSIDKALSPSATTSPTAAISSPSSNIGVEMQPLIVSGGVVSSSPSSSLPLTPSTPASTPGVQSSTTDVNSP